MWIQPVTNQEGLLNVTPVLNVSRLPECPQSTNSFICQGLAMHYVL